MKTILLIALIGFTFCGCTKAEDDAKTELSGNWKWTGSTGGVAGTTETPESTGDQRHLEISRDSIKRFLNDSLIFSTSYTIEIRESILYNEPREMMISNSDIQQIVDLKENNLILTDDCFDCYINSYVKE